MKKDNEKGGVAWGFFITMIFLMGICNKEDGPPTESDYKYVGRQRLESRLKDPDSLQIISENITYESGKPVYHTKYRAKNGFGGYVVDEFTTK